eukprot:gene21378-27408_t
MSMVNAEYIAAAMEFSDNNPLLFLNNWGLPSKVLERYNKLKVTNLFQWQVECLTVNNSNVLTNNGNLIYSAPTSGGKTLVSELLMLKQLSRHAPRSGTIFFVVPFVALAEEKTLYFQEVWQDMNIGVKSFHSDDGTGTALPCDVEVAVCTIERANILLTSLLDERRESQLKMIVVDEIHMLSDSHRGFLLEVMLSKVKYLLRDEVQIVGMSATLPNIEDLAGWLGASLYTTAFRPVSLDVSVCVNRSLYVLDPTATVQSTTSVVTAPVSTVCPTNSSVFDLYNTTGTVCTTEDETEMQVDQNSTSKSNLTANQSTAATTGFKPYTSSAYPNHVPPSSLVTSQANLPSNLVIGRPLPPVNSSHALTTSFALSRVVAPLIHDDADGMKSLCMETANNGKSVMLFCNSKRRCEVCAQSVALAIQQANNQNANSTSSSSFGKVGSYSEHLRQGRTALLEELGQTQVGLCPTLRVTVPQGVAYHHAGLTLDERKIVEEGFRRGFILVLCTTSTLSAGVNLPAHRVVIRSPRMGDQLINVAAFRQMCGRAGRMGLDKNGEAILMVASGNRAEKDHAQHLLTADLDPLVSTLHVAHGGGLEKLLLEMVSCGRLVREAQVMDFVDCTLMKVQQPSDKILTHTREALLFLKKEQFVQTSTRGDLAPSPLGVATTLSGIAPKDAVQILKSLQDARAKLILKGGLHPVFLVTPPTTTIEPDWNNYEKVLDVLFREHPDARPVAEYLGIEQSQLCVFAFKNPSYSSSATNPIVQLYKRFYSAILLFTLIQEWPITRVTQMISTVTRGQLQQLQKDASTFCGMTVVFCKKLNWLMLACCLEDYCSRLNYGANKDILPLVRIGSEVTSSRARVFLKNDIASAQDLLTAGVQRVTQLLVETLPYSGRDCIDATNTTSGNKASSSGGAVSSRELSHQACERLARKILSRARDSVQEEVDLLNS